MYTLASCIRRVQFFFFFFFVADYVYACGFDFLITELRFSSTELNNCLFSKKKLSKILRTTAVDQFHNQDGCSMPMSMVCICLTAHFWQPVFELHFHMDRRYPRMCRGPEVSSHWNCRFFVPTGPSSSLVMFAVKK